MHPAEAALHRAAAERGDVLGRGDHEPVGVGIAGGEDPLRVERLGRERGQVGEGRHGRVERGLDLAGQRPPGREPRRPVQAAGAGRGPAEAGPGSALGSPGAGPDCTASRSRRSATVVASGPSVE